MKVLKTIGEVSLVFLAIISLFVCGLFLYYHFCVKDLVVGVTNISDQVGVDIVDSKNLSEEEREKFEDRYFLEANYFSNSKNNGIELQELNLNYFRDYTLTSDKYRSTGMQYIGDYKHSDVTVHSDSERDNYVFQQFYYYDTTDGISYEGHAGNAGVNTMLKRSSSFTVKIDEKPYEIKLDKSYDTGWWIFGQTHYYTYSELFQSVMDAIESNSAGFGDYYITVNLSDFFTVYEYNLETGKAIADDVSDIIKNYAVMKFHYDENGAVNSSQSMFGIIACNSKYDLEDDDVDTSYWQERMIYNLKEDSVLNNNNLFNFRYSELYKGYFVSLSSECRQMFVNMPRAKVNIVFDLESQYLKDNKINIIGIDYNAFENFRIDSLTFLGKSQKISVLDKGLYNTKLQTLKHSSGVTFDFAENSINSEYSEVVV